MPSVAGPGQSCGVLSPHFLPCTFVCPPRAASESIRPYPSRLCCRARPRLRLVPVGPSQCAQHSESAAAFPSVARQSDWDRPPPDSATQVRVRHRNPRSTRALSPLSGPWIVGALASRVRLPPSPPWPVAAIRARRRPTVHPSRRVAGANRHRRTTLPHGHSRPPRAAVDHQPPAPAHRGKPLTTSDGSVAAVRVDCQPSNPDHGCAQAGRPQPTSVPFALTPPRWPWSRMRCIPLSAARPTFPSPPGQTEQAATDNAPFLGPGLSEPAVASGPRLVGTLYSHPPTGPSFRVKIGAFGRQTSDSEASNLPPHCQRRAPGNVQGRAG